MDMKKSWKILLCATFMLQAINSSAQTFAEFFRQNSTQRKYLVQQIAALKVYAGYAKTGYDIARDGLSTIRSISNGEFNLHGTFLASLKSVSPHIRKNAKAAETVSLQIAIIQQLSGLGKADGLRRDQRDYVTLLSDNIMSECGKDLDELLLIITSGKAEMSDDERLIRLDKVYVNMRDKAAFVQSFGDEIRLMLYQRAGEMQSMERLIKLYEK